jgi:hypothetical protein
MNYLFVLKNGTYYFPAWKHYGDPKLNVICDRCNKNHLTSCVGVGYDVNGVDLCLDCVQKVEKLENHCCCYHYDGYAGCGNHNDIKPCLFK